MLASIIVIGAIVYLESGSSQRRELDADFEILGITNWINSEPLTLEELRGKVVLVDFWTYSCNACIRTLPYLEAWHEKYNEFGFVIIGVHSPEFGFEKSLANVEDAVERFNVQYPVAMDNNFDTWRWFGNRYWPTKYLFNVDGNLRIQHSGEGGYETMETIIQELLTQKGEDVSMIPLEPEDKYKSLDLGDPYEFNSTRELFAIGGIINDPDQSQEEVGKVELFVDEGVHESAGLYLRGGWVTMEDHVFHSEGSEGHLLIVYWGKATSPVIGSATGEPFNAIILLDGKPIPQGFAGADVRFDSEGNSFVFVEGPPRLYSIINANVANEKHEVKFLTESGIAIWSVTFGL